MLFRNDEICLHRIEMVREFIHSQDARTFSYVIACWLSDGMTLKKRYLLLAAIRSIDCMSLSLFLDPKFDIFDFLHEVVTL